MSCSNQQLPLFDELAYLIIPPFAIVCSLFIMITFWVYPNTRKPPGDILLAISISNFVLCVTQIFQAFYQIENNGDQIAIGSCRVIAIIQIMASAADFTYNVAFCLYLQLTFRNPLKQNLWKVSYFHIGAFILISTLPIFLYFIDMIGVNNEGLCGVTELKQFPYLRAIILFFQITISYYVYHSIQKIMISNMELNRYFIRYIKIMIFVNSLCLISLTLEGLNCQFFNLDSLRFLTSITNLTKLIEPMALSIVRGNDPMIKDKLRRLIRSIFRKYVVPDRNESSNPFLDLKEKAKIKEVKTILTGIIRECQPLSQNSLQELNEIEKNNYQVLPKRLSLIDNQIIKTLQDQYDLQHDAFYNLKQVEMEETEETKQITMSVYSPQIFQLIRKKDNAMINIEKSLNLIDNYESIMNIIGPDGGKSGEFFFFSYDNKLILKTITQQEVQSFLGRLGQFTYHYLSEQLTLLSKIYGIYSFNDGQKEQFIILQRNISQAPKQYILRTYDLKGSEYEREVKIQNNEELSKKTLKDINFMNLEKQVKISYDSNLEIVRALTLDCQLLQKLKLMDYSLLIQKVDWDSYCFESQTKIQDIMDQFQSNYYIIQSSEEFGIYYHIAIIDYLQEWTAKKVIERQGKQLLYTNQDPSALEPFEYGERFKKKLIEQIFQR